MSKLDVVVVAEDSRRDDGVFLRIVSSSSVCLTHLRSSLAISETTMSFVQCMRITHSRQTGLHRMQYSAARFNSPTSYFVQDLPDSSFIPARGVRGAELCPKGKAQRMATAWYEQTPLVLSLWLRHIKLTACLGLLALPWSGDAGKSILSSMSLSAISSALICLSLSANCRYGEVIEIKLVSRS